MNNYRYVTDRIIDLVPIEDITHPYFEAKASLNNARWELVDEIHLFIQEILPKIRAAYNLPDDFIIHANKRSLFNAINVEVFKSALANEYDSWVYDQEKKRAQIISEVTDIITEDMLHKEIDYYIEQAIEKYGKDCQ